MIDYLKFIHKTVNLYSENAHFVTICNKEGVLEYCKAFKNIYSVFTRDLGSSVIGRHVLDIYDNLTEENSIVMRTLQTGETIAGQHQHLIFGDTALSIVSTTVPAFSCLACILLRPSNPVKGLSIAYKTPYKSA